MSYFLQALRGFVFVLIAAIMTTIIASVLSTQRVIGGLTNLGVKTPLSERLSMTLYDLQHFGSLYGLFVFLGLLLALFIASDLSHRIKKLRLPLMIGAGMVSMFVMLFLMKQVFFGVPIVAGARDGFGLFLQMLAGGAGGYVFYLLTKPKPEPEAQD